MKKIDFSKIIVRGIDGNPFMTSAGCKWAVDCGFRKCNK